MEEKNRGNNAAETPPKENDFSVPNKRDYEEELLAIIQSDLPSEEIREKLTDYHDNDIASVFGELTQANRRKLYHILSDDEISDIFSYLDNVEDYIAELDAEKAADIIESMDADDAVDVLDELEDDTRNEIIDLMDDEAVEDIEMISSYGENTVGSRMTTNFISVPDNYSVKQAMKSVIDQAAENDNISTIYATDEQGAFRGAIDLRDLVIARSTQDLKEIITESYPYVYAAEDIADCIEKLKEYSEDSIPVLDNENRILGVITSADIVEAVDEEMGEDYAKLAGLTAEEDLQESLKESMRKRMPWLVLLLGLGLVVSSVVGMFETVVSQIAIVMCFQSLILDMAGNVGTQSLAVTIRVLMDENLNRKDKFGLILKEMRIGFANGLFLGIMAFVFIGLYVCFIKGNALSYSFLISGCVGVSLMLAMVISSLVGTTIPLLFHKIKVDPAVASGPLITTVNDLVAVVTYYGLVWLFMIELLKI